VKEAEMDSAWRICVAVFGKSFWITLIRKADTKNFMLWTRPLALSVAAVTTSMFPAMLVAPFVWVFRDQPTPIPVMVFGFVLEPLGADCCDIESGTETAVK
jgi:hypothetical protein